MSKIDFQKGIIIGKSGTIYKIAPERISTARFAHFEIHSSLLAYNMSFQQINDSYISIYNSLTGPINGLGINSAIEECKLRLRLIKDHPSTDHVPRFVTFCAIFCIQDNEDLTTFTDDMVRSKFDDWKDIPARDFFLLYKELIPSFKQNYNQEILV